MEIETNTIISKIKERCEKGRSIELTPIDVDHLLVYIREQEKKIERLRCCGNCDNIHQSMCNDCRKNEGTKTVLASTSKKEKDNFWIIRCDLEE